MTHNFETTNIELNSEENQMPLIAHRLRANGRTAPEGVDPDSLEFSWQMAGDATG